MPKPPTPPPVMADPENHSLGSLPGVELGYGATSKTFSTTVGEKRPPTQSAPGDLPTVTGMGQTETKKDRAKRQKWEKEHPKSKHPSQVFKTQKGDSMNPLTSGTANPTTKGGLANQPLPNAPFPTIMAANGGKTPIALDYDSRIQALGTKGTSLLPGDAAQMQFMTAETKQQFNLKPGEMTGRSSGNKLGDIFINALGDLANEIWKLLKKIIDYALSKLNPFNYLSDGKNSTAGKIASTEIGNPGIQAEAFKNIDNAQGFWNKIGATFESMGGLGAKSRDAIGFSR